ncbi:unnamed protein product [Meganyctiphanes norvegica]|uniref:63 kDa sperm flagellar membrane protein n=1 Tax=Meganyctiphanes norvegica TaxID=48144 RepID=A0AAV2PYW2_MEGNR
MPIQEAPALISDVKVKNEGPTAELVTSVVNYNEVTEIESLGDYDLIMETITGTATVYDEESLQHMGISHRVERSISDDFMANEFRAFRSLPSTPSLSTFMDVQSSTISDRRKSDRKSDPDPDIDDIIQGIMHLLGGNVKVTAAEHPDPRLTTFGNRRVASTRINNRGPPNLLGSRLPVRPVRPDLASKVIRPPVRPPFGLPPGAILRPLPGQPPFIANTRPSFLAPLPPTLVSKRPQRPINRPFVTGFPLPISLIDEDDIVDDTAPISPDLVVTPQFHDRPYDNLNPGPYDIPNGGSDYYQEATPVLSSSTEELPEEDFDYEEPTRLTNNLAMLRPFHSSDATPTEDTEVPLSSVNIPPFVEEETQTSLEPSLQTTQSSSLLEPSTTTPPPQVSTTVPVEPTKPIPIETIINTADPTTIRSSTTTRKTTTTTSEPPISSSSSPTPPLPPITPPAPPPTSPTPKPHSGVVLDDKDYRPGQVITGAVIPFDGRPGDIFDVTVSAHQGYAQPPSQARPPTHVRPVRPPPPPPRPQAGEIFDVTVSAMQGGGLGQPQVVPVDPLDLYNEGLITTPAGGNDGFVSIDGRKTYFDLFPTGTETNQAPQQQQTVGMGVGIVIPEDDIQGDPGSFFQQPPPPQQRPQQRPPQKPRPKPTTPQAPPKPSRPQTSRPTYTRRPSNTPIRIDTCIVGDDSTCQEQLGEVCRTEDGVSSCYCKPGTARKRHRTKCKSMIALRMSMKVDRVGIRRIFWNGNYGNPESEEYRELDWESRVAINAAMSKTPMASAYLGSNVHKFYSIGGRVIINSTVMLEDLPTTRSRNIRQALQRQLIQVIRNHGNNIGDSQLFVDGPLNPIPEISDVNECADPILHDCHADAYCVNQFGTFTCKCQPGYTDRQKDNPVKAGRKCESCSTDYCNKRGVCSIKNGHKFCTCKGSYYGYRCEIDGEVLGVAVGASVAAVVIIILTLIFLCMWSRRWKQQDRKADVIRSPMGLGGFAVNLPHKAGAGGPYGVTLDDRMRWAQVAENMSQHQNQNLYAPQYAEINGAAVYTANSNEYLTSDLQASNPFNVYNRVTRALSNSSVGRMSAMGKGGIFGRLKNLFGGTQKSHQQSQRVPSHLLTQNPTMNLQQLMALQTHLATSSQDQVRGMGQSAPSTAGTIYNKNQRGNFSVNNEIRMGAGASSTNYAASLGGTLSQYQQYPPQQLPQTAQQQFGMQHLNPMGHLASMASLQQQIQQQQHMQQQQQQAFGAQSSYGQYGPVSLNAMSQGNVSRAPTLGARTPVPRRNEGRLGASTVGPMGGASITMAGIESSEEEMDRPYHLPRPKSRGSLAVGSLAAQQSRIARSYNSLLF